jgi:hypothetical protein
MNSHWRNSPAKVHFYFNEPKVLGVPLRVGLFAVRGTWLPSLTQIRSIKKPQHTAGVWFFKKGFF